MAFVVLFTESSLFLSDFPAGKLVVLGPAGVTTATVVDPGRVLAGGATSILSLFVFGSSCSTIKFCCCTPEGSPSSCNPLSPGTAIFKSFSSLAVAHTQRQQHRASTNRAQSRRHVIIVSVVVQWCGADPHSEGHGEQQGRREVRQTHTEGTPHEERAAARHAPYAAHHARHTLQSTTPTHRWKRKKQTGAAHKAPPHAHTARAVRRACTPHGGYADTQEEVHLPQQHKIKVTIKIGMIPAHHVDC
ncbi:hypothetical protein MOQ_005473 [Trypanosoma cruzi marinkellei]|uniref:Uncharacterized protein n=1 Tax=Trypanosoma cruzi marinkellei TaxID=85056 RepID=K2MY27_TRYCR|nr:hypothetical protein MOQ_005473 [Trypanosoma cruzi marinkellei]